MPLKKFKMTTYTNEEWFYIYKYIAEYKEHIRYNLETQRESYAAYFNTNQRERDTDVFGVEEYREIYVKCLKKAFDVGEYKIGK